MMRVDEYMYDGGWCSIWRSAGNVAVNQAEAIGEIDSITNRCLLKCRFRCVPNVSRNFYTIVVFNRPYLVRRTKQRRCSHWACMNELSVGQRNLQHFHLCESCTSPSTNTVPPRRAQHQQEAHALRRLLHRLLRVVFEWVGSRESIPILINECKHPLALPVRPFDVLWLRKHGGVEHSHSVSHCCKQSSSRSFSKPPLIA